MSGKGLWRCIRYLECDNKIQDADLDFCNGKLWWEYWNDGTKVKKYSYKWCCNWLKEHPNVDIWDELFQTDLYLKKLCEIRKISMIDQLVYYADERYNPKNFKIRKIV